MTNPVLPYRIFPLGDSAITVDFGAGINEAINKEVLNRFYQLQLEPLPGMTEASPAYSSFTVYYNVIAASKIVPAGKTVFDWMKQQLVEFLEKPAKENPVEGKLISIPVCYEDEFAPDLQQAASAKQLSTGELVQIHLSREYKVYMLGFLPGFAYMGEVDERIVTGRKPQPVTVAAGSVGIAGKQTGIYPVSSPGGWQIIGRTPVKLFDKEKDNPVLLNAGDRIRFYSISRHEFENY